MGTPRLTKEQVSEAVELVRKHGTVERAADAKGISRGAMANRFRAQYRPEFSECSLRSRLAAKPTQHTKTPKAEPNTENILVIGDLHEPFCLDEYLDFCVETYKHYNCTHVIFIGDIIDNHFTSYHEVDPDGLGGGDELSLAISRVGGRWVDAFPVADVAIGNHDRLIARKAMSSGISGRWLKDYNEVLEAPDWDFKDEFVYDNVRYIHGENGTARTKIKKDLISTVQGHLHTQGYTEHLVGLNFHIFGMQVGCGIDRKAYAMAYAKAGPKPVIGCGVILNHGTLPINILADL